MPARALDMALIVQEGAVPTDVLPPFRLSPPLVSLPWSDGRVVVLKLQLHSRNTMVMGGILGVMFLVFASLVLLATTIATELSAVSCNGSPDFCGRKYSNVSLIGTHDSAFVGSIYDPRVNQERTVTQQLDAGIRFLQAQTHKNAAGTLSMCHTSCTELDAGSLAGYLREVKKWLERNPNDVVTLLLVNGDNLDPSAFDAVFGRIRVRDYAFVPFSTPRTLAISDWPTLSALIQLNKRLIVFLDSKADTTKVPYILPEFDYFFETPFDTTDPGFKQCSLDRPAGSSPEGKMYIVNHFLDKTALWTKVLVPDNAADARTNAASGKGSIRAQAELCEKMYGRRPNVVLVDMFDRGDVFTAQRALNTYQAPGSRYGFLGLGRDAAVVEEMAIS